MWTLAYVNVCLSTEISHAWNSLNQTKAAVSITCFSGSVQFMRQNNYNLGYQKGQIELEIQTI